MLSERMRNCHSNRIVCLALTPYRVFIPVDRQPEEAYTYVLEKTS